VNFIPADTRHTPALSLLCLSRLLQTFRLTNLWRFNARGDPNHTTRVSPIDWLFLGKSFPFHHVVCRFLSLRRTSEYPRLYLFLCLQRSIYFQHFAFLNILTCDVVFGQARVQRTSFKPHSGSAPGTTFPSMYLASRFRSYHP